MASYSRVPPRLAGAAAWFIALAGFLNDAVLFPLLFPIGQQRPDLIPTFQTMDGLIVAAITFALIPVALRLREFADSSSRAATLALGIGVAAALIRGVLFLFLGATASDVGSLHPLDDLLQAAIGLWIVLANVSVLGSSALPRPLAWLGTTAGAAMGIRYAVVPDIELVNAINFLGVLVWLLWLGWILFRTPRDVRATAMAQPPPLA